MLSQFFALLTAGVMQPRPIVRRIIDAKPDTRDRLTLVGLSAVIEAFFYVLAALLTGVEARVGLGDLLVLIAGNFLLYALIAFAGFHLGRRLGGQGSPEALATAAAWYGVLRAALSPLVMLAFGGGGLTESVGPIRMISALICFGLVIWLLGACIAEAHRFANTGRVVAATFGAMLAFSVLVSLLISSVLPT